MKYASPIFRLPHFVRKDMNINSHSEARQSRKNPADYIIFINKSIPDYEFLLTRIYFFEQIFFVVFLFQ